MSTFLVWVNTCNRVKLLTKLISDIQSQKSKHEIDLFVINDGSTQDYSAIQSAFTYSINFSQPHGKEAYWKVIDKGMKFLHSLNKKYDYYVKTDDDIRLVDNFFDTCVSLIKCLPDMKWATMDILSAPKQRGKTLLGNYADSFHNTYKYYRTQWVDMNFLFDLSKMPTQIGPCTSGKASSGVGLWMTRHLLKKGYNLYQAPHSLVLHNNHESIMNSEERKKHPLITRGPK